MTVETSPDKAIPDPINHITTAIDEAIERDLAPMNDWGGIPMSSVANPCDRSIWYSLRWAHPPEQITARKERIFETGRIYEDRLIACLRKAGVDVETVDPATGRQHSVTLAGGYVRGKLDGIATGVPTAEKTIHVVECKSLKAADYRAILKHGLAKAKPDHYAQCQMYMHATGVLRCLYIAANKDTDELLTERIRYDAAFCIATEARLTRIVEAATPPARISDDPDAFACKFCPARAVCHEAAWARSVCRTCISVTPSGDNGWTCERHGRSLSRAEQQEGCGDHRFIPDLVPGEQVDVMDGDLIVYRMPGGDIWIDGVRE